MTTEYEYLEFIQCPSTGKTTIWSCRNKRFGDQLGVVKWDGRWRQYCYFTGCENELGVVYSTGCLNDISSFVKQLNDERKLCKKSH
jgi:hypothetical protein